MCWQHLVVLDAYDCFILVHFEKLAQFFNVGELEIIFAELLLALQIDISICELIVPADVLEISHSLQRHRNSFQSIGQFDGDWIQIQSTRLLEVSELGDFKTIQPDLPA